MKALRSLFIVTAFAPSLVWAQTPTPAQMGITTATPNAVQVLDSSQTWATIGTVDPATHLFSPAGIPALPPLVNSFNTRTGAVTLSSGDVTGALGFTPYNATNPAGYINTAVAAAAAPVQSVATRTGAITLTHSDITDWAATLLPYALLNSPAFTGTPSLPTGTTGVTQTAGDSSTKLATTAFVGGAVTSGAYTLPTASTTVLGGVKVDGSTINISGGVISGAPSGITKNTTSTSSYTAGQFLTSDGSKTQADPLFTSVLAPTNGPTVQVGGGNMFMGDPSSGRVIILAIDATNGGSAWPSIGFQVGNFGWGASGIVGQPSGYYGFSNPGYMYVLPEVSIHRNGTRNISTIATSAPTSPTTFDVYNTYTDGSNGEWGALDWQTVANTLLIGTEKNGTGSARNLELVVGGVNKLDYGVTVANAWSSIGNFGSTGAMVSRGTQPTITGSGGTCAVTTKVGGAWAGTVVLSAVCASTNTITWTGMPAVPNGYVCDAEDRTTQTAGPFIESASTTTGFTIKVGATSSVAADVLQWKCMGY